MRWFEVLACYPPEALHAATEGLLRQAYPSYARDHLKALLPLLRELEARRLQEQAKTVRTDERGTCTRCGGTGWVCDLPHLRDLSGQEWRGRYTMAVLCDCGLGRTMARDWKEGRPRPLTWSEYAAANPRWYIQRTVHYQRHQAEGAALRQAEKRGDKDLQIGTALDGVLARLRAKTLQKGNDGQEEG